MVLASISSVYFYLLPNSANFAFAHFEQVTLLERDQFPDELEVCPGMPKGTHVYGLLLHGQQTVEWLFLDSSKIYCRQGRYPWIGSITGNS